MVLKFRWTYATLIKLCIVTITALALVRFVENDYEKH